MFTCFENTAFGQAVVMEILFFGRRLRRRPKKRLQWKTRSRHHFSYGFGMERMMARWPIKKIRSKN